MKNYLKILMLAGVGLQPLTSEGQVPVAAQWHFAGNNVKGTKGPPENPSSQGGTDWVYCVLPTQRKEYIACGYSSGTHNVAPVVFKLDKYGRLVWIRQVTSASGSGLTYDDTQFGYFTQVIKSPRGYIATGAAYTTGTNPQVRSAIAVEVDEAGGYVHAPTLFRDAGLITSQGRCSTMDEDANNPSLYIAGNAMTTSTGKTPMFIYKIDYNSWSLTGTGLYGNYIQAGTGGNNAFKIKSVQTSPTDNELYVCGYKSALDGDNKNYHITNGSGVSASLDQRNKDIWFLKVNSGLQVLLDKTYNKADIAYPTSICYTEVGPYSARGILSPFSQLGSATTATQYLNSDVNRDERGYDFTFTQDGNIAIVALVNMIMTYGYLDGNGGNVVQSPQPGVPGVVTGGFVDPVRNNYFYDEYTDGDGYLLKVDPSDGHVLYSKNVSHFSSKDFYPQIFQNGQGNFIISGSSADYSPIGYDQPEEYDGLILETPDAPNPNIGQPDHIWRRGYHAEGNEDGLCTFTLAQTADGGFVLGGDNDEDNDNFSITKFSPYCSSKMQSSDYAIDSRVTNNGQYDIGPSAYEVWPNNVVLDGSNIASRVVVHKGSTLVIHDCHLNFASSDHTYDYWDLADGPKAKGRMIGIVVEQGGRLVIDNATLSGMDDCQSGSPGDRYMWDGIVVMGSPLGDRTAVYQGSLEMNRAHIEDARIAVAVDDGFRNLDYSTQAPSSTIPDYESENQSSRYLIRGTVGGGIVNATESMVQDCRFGVVYQQYSNPNKVINTYDNCTFLNVLGMADPIFYADDNGGRLPSRQFFGDWAMDNVHIQNSKFYCPDTYPVSVWPVGVVNDDAGYTITDCTFENLSMGMLVNYNGNNLPFTVANNQFTNVGNSINATGATNNMSITGNTFNVPGSEITGHPGGILLQGCTGYRIQNNTFLGMYKPAIYATYPPSSRGIQVTWGSQYTGNNDKIDLNTFDNLRYPLIALQKNSTQSGDYGLRFRCNDFLQNNSRCIAMLSGVAGGTYVAATMKKSQGYCGNGIYRPAGNRFYTNNCSAGNSERLYADFLVSQNVDYYYPALTGSPEYNPTTPCITTPRYTLQSCNGWFDRSVVCDPSFADPYKGPSALSLLDDSIRQMAPDAAGYTDLVADRDALVSDQARQFGLAQSYDAAGDLMTSYNRNTEALAFYMTGRNWKAAKAAWARLSRGTADEQRYAELTRMAIDLYSVGKTWKDLDAAKKAQVTEWAAQNTASGFFAASVADRIGTRPLTWYYAVDTVGTMGTTPKGESGATLPALAEASTVKIYPNPTNGVFTIAASEKGRLSLSNLQGAVLATYPIDAHDTNIAVPKQLVPGIYYARFVAASGRTTVVKIVYAP